MSCFQRKMNLSEGTLNNQGKDTLIFSAGDLAIGGSLDSNRNATWQAVAVNNHAATIESLGDLAISAASIQNTNAGVTTSTVPEGSQLIQEVQPEGWSRRNRPMFPQIS